MGKKTNKEHRKGLITAKLIFFDWGWRENVIYKIQAKQNNKEKGLLMIEAIRNYFSINGRDEKKSEEVRIKKEVEKINWTRDEKGKIISPFSKKAKEMKDERE